MKNFHKIIVTGAGGWLGYSLLRHLSESVKKPGTLFHNSEIVALIQDHESKKLLSDFDVVLIKGDLRSESTINDLLEDAKGAVVFNLAGIIHPTFFGNRTFDEVNHRAIVNFAKKCADRGVRKFVAMSSNSPCGYSKDTSYFFDEASVYSPYMGYGRSKMLMEKGLLNISNSSSNTNFTIIFHNNLRDLRDLRQIPLEGKLQLYFFFFLFEDENSTRTGRYRGRGYNTTIFFYSHTKSEF